MRLPGRIAAAIEVLADIEERHRPVAEALRDWGVSHRFAGSSDRAAIGDLVHDALRRKLSIAWRMGDDAPWALAMGTVLCVWRESPALLNQALADDPHAPRLIPEAVVERLATADLSKAPGYVQADIPYWIVPDFEEAFEEAWVEEGAALAGRPPLDLRVNTLKGDRDRVLKQLARFGAEPAPISPVGIRIAPGGVRRRLPNVQAEEGFQRGRYEVQDEGSQLCALLAGARPGEQVLDFCAGAGGKTLALAAAMENKGQIFAYDGDRLRLAPIYERLKRNGVRNVQVRPPEENALAGLEGRMDRVLVDAPCSGSGVWRRRPDAKWRLTAEAVVRRTAEQDAVLAGAAPFVRPGGRLVYATCSVLPQENEARVTAFLDAHPDFRIVPAEDAWRGAFGARPVPLATRHDWFLFSPRRSGTDGFYACVLCRMK
ncbi:RsmB/NOP family class I SAM-dependent RNA methyltransferase [Propylenella binzhouense]|uniref:RsmB/NOP family class I SAM-dependent RNA methyltransferase n=1 Tax=Propylenella binzhouense TaxID=2555902 RepID=A0A964WUX5_9HYPH|nr:RsmB/NOP family class I SAM-dependent RNA methyltransferase [Propylenella binzhouense]MYZ49597.1 RsmB/NOP family class I SAM-dependent RNA methyltransferase [Propylenella binzhouense]